MGMSNSGTNLTDSSDQSCDQHLLKYWLKIDLEFLSSGKASAVSRSVNHQTWVNYRSQN